MYRNSQQKRIADMMTRKDYRAIAGAIRAEWDHCTDIGECQVVIAIANNIAAILAVDNYRFDRQKFLAAAINQPL